MDTNEMSLISIGLYNQISDIVGREKIIRIRRTVTDLNNELYKAYGEALSLPTHAYLSGSKAEGFRFSSSDYDYMWVYRDVRVIESTSQCRLYDVNTTLLMMETEQTKPGFALLRLVGDTNNSDIGRACIPFQSGMYLSSQRWRDNNPYIYPGENIHGPCASGTLGKNEYDFAFCVKSDNFLKAANNAMKRLEERGWPSSVVLREIISGGCHFVAIPAKVPNFELLEWRLSFSIAERKLTHAMNQTQFLCYGLLKIVLKEAISCRPDLEGILCSYYLKTAVLWEIMDESQEWNPTSFLDCFLKCFRRLIHWINEEYCPNFFIPENNMLLGKFNDGKTKTELLGHLTTMYGEGYKCLLRCPSLHDRLSAIIEIPTAVTFIRPEEELVTKTLMDLHTIIEIDDAKVNLFYNDEMSLECVYCCDRLIERCDSELQRLTLHVWKNSILCHLLFLCFSQIVESSKMNQKLIYNYITKLLCAIKGCTFDPVYHYLLMSVGMNKLGKFQLASRIVLEIKKKMKNPFIMYPWALIVEKYKAAEGEHEPLVEMMRKVVTRLVCLDAKTCIPELLPEHQANMQQISADIIFFPPLVLGCFIQFLVHWKTGEHDLCSKALKDLFEVVHGDYGHRRHIPDECRAISLEILGICQEMVGDYNGAYKSFTTALQNPYSNIKLATQMRLLRLLHILRQ